MASIAGSQFDATAGTPVNVVITSDGSSLPPPVPGDFNLEVWTGGNPPTSPASGYQGLLYDLDGLYANMISGAFALTDTGSGSHYIVASDNSQTVVGASGDIIETLGTGDSVTGNSSVIIGEGSNSTFNLATGNNFFFGFGGNNDTVTGGPGNNYAFFAGTGNTYTGGSGNDTVMASVGSTGDSITAGSGNDLIYSLDQHNTIQGGSGSDTVEIFANNDSLAGGSGSLNAEVVGTGNTVTGGSGPDSILLVGNTNTVAGGSGADTITLYGNTNSVTIGSGPDAISILGANDTVTAGAGNSSLDYIVTTSNATFVDSAATYNDTIVGFDNSAGDTIHLTGSDTSAYALAHQSSQNGGQDTLLTLNDGSTILLKGVTTASGGFFS